VLTVAIYPNPILRQKTVKVTKFDESILRLVDEMFKTMSASNGIGLAAPQIGLLDAVFVVAHKDHRKAYINPEITWSSKEISWCDEGCLSLPDVVVAVERPRSVKVKAQDVYGQWFEDKLDGMTATVFQHELDHLDGVLIIDKGTPKASE